MKRRLSRGLNSRMRNPAAPWSNLTADCFSSSFPMMLTETLACRRSGETSTCVMLTISGSRGSFISLANSELSSSRRSSPMRSVRLLMAPRWQGIRRRPAPLFHQPVFLATERSSRLSRWGGWSRYIRYHSRAHSGSEPNTTPLAPEPVLRLAGARILAGDPLLLVDLQNVSVLKVVEP